MEGLPTCVCRWTEGPPCRQTQVSPSRWVLCTHHAHRQELDLDPQSLTVGHDKNDLVLKNFQSRCD